MSPDGEDIFRLIPWEWNKGIDPIYDYSIRSYALSPDGEKVAFILEKYNKRRWVNELSQLWIVDRDGKNLTLVDSYNLQQGYTPIENIAWSPNSEYIIYKNYNGNISGYRDDELWIIKPNGTDKMKLLTITGAIFNISWSP